jgi:hypothetical protein
LQLLTELEPQAEHSRVRTASGQSLPVCGKGSVSFAQNKVSDIYYVPGVAKNLLSIGSLADQGDTAEFNSKTCVVYNQGDLRKVLLKGDCDPTNRLYKLRVPSPDQTSKLLPTKSLLHTSDVWSMAVSRTCAIPYSVSQCQDPGTS